jgi:hypothetical protein
MPNISAKQANLLQWMRERAAHNGLTATEIADVMPYDTMNSYPRKRCFDDLKDLAAQGLVECDSGRPARWTVVT